MTSYELIKVLEHVQNAVALCKAGTENKWEEIAYLKSKDELLKLAAMKQEEKKPKKKSDDE